MEQLLRNALIGNAAALGLNWIYDMPFLERLSQKEPIIFLTPDQSTYDQSKKSYFAYPNAKPGDVSFQGNIAIWLYQTLKNNPQYPFDKYDDLLYENIKEGSNYDGYIEAYGRKLIEDRLEMSKNPSFFSRPFEDDQLVGFVPYLVCHQLGLTTTRALKFAHVFGTHPDYLLYFNMLDAFFRRVKNQSHQEVIKTIIKGLPKDKRETFEQAIEMTDTKKYIATYAGTACHIDHAVPVIFHVVYHSQSFEEGLVMNTRIGGASSDRGMLIGAMLGEVFEVESSFIKKTNKTLALLV
jgi:hypothetical protein